VKILDIILSLNPADGGPQHTTRTMSRIWRSMGHQADILSLDAPDAPYLEPGLPVFALGKCGAPNPQPGWSSLLDHYGYYPGAVAKAARIVRDYDVVLVHALWNYSSLLSRRILVGGKVPYFVFIHGMLDPWHKEAYPRKDKVKQMLWPLCDGALCNNALATFFTTQVEVELANRSYLPYRLNPIMTGYGCEGPDDRQADAQRAAFLDRHPELRGRKFLIFLSRIHPKKGCDTLFRAFAAALPQLGDMHLVMAGPDQIGWRTELEALARECGIADRVHWTGIIGGDVKWGAYRLAEAFVLPSHGENFGIVVAEAMACGTPVIISDRVNLYHAVLEHQAGLVVPHDLDSTTGALRQFGLMSDEERGQMSRRALECYQANYEIQAAARRVLDTMASHAGLDASSPGREVEPA
jgi:glycosyltransferase involved in cell wall biosynthesis